MSIEIYKIISQKKKAGKQKKFDTIETQTISEDQRNPVDTMTRGTEQIYDSPYRRQTVFNTEQAPAFESFHLLSGLTHDNSHISFSGMINMDPLNNFDLSMNGNNSILQQQGMEMNDSIMSQQKNSPSLRPKIRKVRLHQQ